MYYNKIAVTTTSPGFYEKCADLGSMQPREFRNWPTSVNRNPELFRIIQALQDSPDESAEDDEEDEKEDTQFES